MSEQSSQEIKKSSPLKTALKKIAPVALAAITMFTPDSKIPLPTPIIPPAASSEQGQKATERITFKPQVTIIDAGLSVPKEGITQNEFFSQEEFAKKLLGSEYLSKEELEREFGRPINGLAIGEAAVTTGKYKQVLTHAFIERYFSHGDKVMQVMEGVWNKTRLQSTGVELLPLQKILDASSIKEVQDSLGNQGISISFNPQRIIDLLKTDTNRVVNMSFQVGDVDIFLEKKYISIPEPEPVYPDSFRDNDGNVYVGAVGLTTNKDGKLIYIDALRNEVKPTTPDEQKTLRQQKREEAKQKATIEEIKYPQIKIVGAYDRDKARENLPKLFAVASAYPNKLFFAAAGNEGEDFEEALKELRDQKPKNLIIVGQWTANYGPTQKVFGADIYVNNSKLGVPDGSSFSAPALTAYAETLFRQGLSQEEVLDKIKTSSNQEVYDFDLPDVTKEGSAVVFDPTF